MPLAGACSGVCRHLSRGALRRGSTVAAFVGVPSLTTGGGGRVWLSGISSSWRQVRVQGLSSDKTCSTSAKTQSGTTASFSNLGGMACEACMKIPPVVSDYTGTGANEKLGDLTVYFSGSGSDKGIVFIPDIFGVTPQAIQVADKLAGAGFVVGFPDVFRGEPWPMSKFPPPDRNELLSWIGTYGYEDKVKPDIDRVVEALRAKGVSKLAIVGFCWGGKMSTLAAGPNSVFSATASAHPSFLNNDDAAKVTIPILLLPSKDEADLTEFISIVSGKGVPASQHRFDDMHHGWVAARGDWQDPKQAERATEAIQMFADWFKQHLA